MIRFAPIRVHGAFESRRVRFMSGIHFSNLYFHHGIDKVSFSFERNDPEDVILFNGHPVGADGTTEEVTLAVGKNVFPIELHTKEGEMITELKLFRAYPTPAWEQLLEHAPWRPRDSAGEIVFQDKLWLLGGYVPETISDVWSSTDGITWEQHPDCPSKKGIDIPVMFIYDEKMYVLDLDDIFWASADGENWEKICDDAPWAGHSHRIAGGVFKGKIWLFGAGKDQGIWSSSDGGRTWTEEVKRAPWPKRWFDCTLLHYNDKLWLIGGQSTSKHHAYFPFIAYNDVWCSEDGIHWERVLKQAPWLPRYWHSTFIYKNRMWISAGFHIEPEDRHFDDAWYSTDGIHWREFKQHASEWVPRTIPPETDFKPMTPLSIPAPVWGERHETSMVVKDDTLYLMGGMIWPLTNEVWKLKIDGFCFLTQPRFEGCVEALYEYNAFADFSDSLLDAKYRLITAPEWLSVEEETGYVSGVPTKIGAYEIVLEAYTDAGESTRQEYTLDIIE